MEHGWAHSASLFPSHFPTIHPSFGPPLIFLLSVSFHCHLFVNHLLFRSLSIGNMFQNKLVYRVWVYVCGYACVCVCVSSSPQIVLKPDSVQCEAQVPLGQSVCVCMCACALSSPPLLHLNLLLVRGVFLTGGHPQGVAGCFILRV